MKIVACLSRSTPPMLKLSAGPSLFSPGLNGPQFGFVKLAPGYINSLGVKTAGRIAIDLIDLTSTAPNAAAFAAPCAEFKRLVDTRNKLLHGKPGTAPNGDQNLFDRGSAWTIDKINDAADEFASCDRSLNPLMHSLP